MAIDSLSLNFLQEHPKDAARVFEKFDPSELARFLDQTPARTAASVMNYIVPSIATEILKQAQIDKAVEVLTQMGVERTAALLRRFSDSHRDQIIKAMSPVIANMIKLVLRYPEGTVGRVMNPNVFTVHQDMRVGEVITAIRNAAEILQHEVYVVNDKQQIAGVVDVKKLLTCDASEPMKNIMKAAGESLSARTDLNTVLEHPDWGHRENMPVIDNVGAFIGILNRRSLHQTGYEHEKQDEVAGTALAVAELFWDACADVLTPGYDNPQKEHQDERHD